MRASSSTAFAWPNPLNSLHDLSASSPHPLWKWLRRGLTVAGFCVAIATLLWLMRGNPWDVDLVYSLGTGMTTWAMIEGGISLMTHGSDKQWPAGWRGPALLLVSIALGYVVGTTLGDAYRGGVSSWADWRGSPRAFASYIAISLAASIVVTYYFFSKGKAQAQATRLAAAERDAAEAKLAMLQSQIEPHMLFNTLANLRVLIAMDPPRAQAMLDQLIAFLRATLEASRGGSHSLNAEFARIGDYLALMQIRMGARLEARLDLPAELAQMAVPPLLLQPLVENAIKHGLEPKVDGGRIDVSARREAGALVLTVRDTGVGLEAPPADGARFGLHQVRERLATLHGDAARLSLDPAADADGGCVAIIHLPITEAR